MKVYAVVPVKHLATSKSRLASILTPENRKRLTLAMLEDVLNAIRDSTIQGTVVVGSDLCVCELAMNAGVAFINIEARGLNPAIGDSIKWCMKRGADSVLVLPADIPLLSSTDINRIIELAGNAEAMVVVSSSKNGGTNALYLRPPNLIPVSYGPGSFKKHIRHARVRDIPVKVYYSFSVAFDIDSQEDLQELLKNSSTTFSTQFIAKVLRKEYSANTSSTFT
jgi:2-phospho-L-lactate guanylyltransferase